MLDPGLSAAAEVLVEARCAKGTRRSAEKGRELHGGEFVVQLQQQSEAEQHITPSQDACQEENIVLTTFPGVNQRVAQMRDDLAHPGVKCQVGFTQGSHS